MPSVQLDDDDDDFIGLLAESLPMAQETGVQAQVESYQRFKKMLLELRPPLHLCVVATEKGAFWLPTLLLYKLLESIQLCAIKWLLLNRNNYLKPYYCL